MATAQRFCSTRLPDQSNGRVLVVIAVVAALTRVWLIRAAPLLPPGDSYTRLVDPGVLLKGPWLPGYQFSLAMLSLLSRSPEVFRVATLIQGVAAAVACAAFAMRVWGPGPGLATGVCVALLPTFSVVSTALYPESLLLLLLALAGWAWAGGGAGWVWISLVGASCLVRYEGWLIAGSLAAVNLARGRFRVGAALAIAPVAWMVYSGGLTPVGAGWLEPIISVKRLILRGSTLWALAGPWGLRPLWLGAFVVCGLAFGSRERRTGALTLAWSAVTTFCFLAVVDPYESVDNPRQLFLPAALGALALGWGVAGGWVSRAAVIVAMLGGGAGLRGSYAAVRPAATDPTVAYGASLGRALAGDLGPRRRALVLADGLPGWPDAVAPECEVVAGYAEVPSAWLPCNLPLPTMDGGIVAELAVSGVHVVVRLGQFDPWKPVHRVAEVLDAEPGAWRRMATATPDFTLWTDLPEVGARIAGRISAGALTLPDSARCRGWPAPDLAGWDIDVVGALTVREPPRIAMYGNGEVTIMPTATGRLAVAVCGTPADGRLPRFRVTQDAVNIELDAPPVVRWLTTISVRAGRPVLFSWTDDRVDLAGHDRNLYLAGLRIDP